MKDSSKAATDVLPHSQRRARRPQTEKQLRRSQHKVIAGLAGGVAHYIDADPATVRWVFAIATFFTAGVFIVIYLLLWLMVPVASIEA